MACKISSQCFCRVSGTGWCKKRWKSGEIPLETRQAHHHTLSKYACNHSRCINFGIVCVLRAGILLCVDENVRKCTLSYDNSKTYVRVSDATSSSLHICIEEDPKNRSYRSNTYSYATAEGATLPAYHGEHPRCRRCDGTCSGNQY